MLVVTYQGLKLFLNHVNAIGKHDVSLLWVV
jgi:hypothetical protein